MKTPPFLLSGIVLLWGWQSGLLWVAAALAVAFEAPRWVQARWDFSLLDLDRIWNLCAGLFFGLVAYLLASQENGLGLGQASNLDVAMSQAVLRGSQASLQFFRLLPLVFVPMLLAQGWGTRDPIPYSTFSWFLRRYFRDPDSLKVEPGINVSWPAFGIFLVGASAGSKAGTFFFVLLILAAWALVPFRSRSISSATWLLAFGAAVAVAVGTQASLRPLYLWVQNLESGLLNRGRAAGFDARESRTQLGQIAALKGSGRIVLRLNVPAGQSPPELLREASYDMFRGVSWQNVSQAGFQSVLSDASQFTWSLRPPVERERSLKIWAPVNGTRSLLPLPGGTVRLTDLPAAIVETNGLGALRIEGPPLVGFNAFYETDRLLDVVPTESDLLVPEVEAAVIQGVAEEIGLRAGQKPDDASRRIEEFFARHFTYSLTQEPVRSPTSNRTPLSRFLIDSHRGHCEYFATAGTLLLRHAGVPARYAVGWSVQEKKGNQFVVRARHAHAWTLAYLDGAWREIDFTPGGWSASERRNGSIFEPIADAWSRVVFEFNRFRYTQTNLRNWLLYPAGLVLLTAVGQLLFRRQWRKREARGKTANEKRWPGQDSDFYAVESRLFKMGFERRPGETLPAWLRRIQAGVPSVEEFQPMLRLHQRVRFDPTGLSSSESAELRRRCLEWLSSQNLAAGRELNSCHSLRNR